MFNYPSFSFGNDNIMIVAYHCERDKKIESIFLIFKKCVIYFL